MANLPNNPFAELRNLETRVDQRLEMLTRAEGNLKTLLDSLRQQVTTAFPVVDQLQKLLPEAKKASEAANVLPTIGELSAALAVGVDQARAEMEERAGDMRKNLIDELQTAVNAARDSVAAMLPATGSRDELNALVAAFRVEAKETLDAVRETLADQLDLLPADAKLRIEPVLGDVDAARQQAEASVRTVADAAGADMRRRADQLRQSIDDISVVLEQRLTQRTAALHQRAEAAMAALQPAMDERLTALLAALEQTIQTRERELVARIDAYPQRLDRQLADAETMLLQALARTEKHATDMTAYPESKLTARVDDLVARLRLKLQQELNQVAGTPTPEPRRPVAPLPTNPLTNIQSDNNPLAGTQAAGLAPMMAMADRADAPPTLQANVFITTRRPNLSPAA